MAIPCPIQPDYCAGTATSREIKAAQGSGIAYVPAVTVCSGTQNLVSDVALNCTITRTVTTTPPPPAGTSPLNPLPYNVNDFLSGINSFVEGIYYDVVFPSSDLYYFNGTSTNGNVSFDIIKTITFETVEVLIGNTYSSFSAGDHYIVRFYSDYNSGSVGGYQFMISNTGGVTSTTTTTVSPTSTTTTLTPATTTTTLTPISTTTTTSTSTTTTTLAPTNTFAFNEFVNVPAGLEVVALNYIVPLGMTLDIYSLTASVSGGPARMQLVFNDPIQEVKLTGFMSSAEPSYNMNILSPFRIISPSVGSPYTVSIKIKNMTRDDQNCYVNFVGDLY